MKASHSLHHFFPDLNVNGEFADVTLVLDDLFQVNVHKIVLSAFSQVLRNLLVNNPHPHPLIYLSGIKQDELHFILKFMYDGEALIPNTMFSDFLETVKTLKILALMKEFNILNHDDVNTENSEIINRSKSSTEFLNDSNKEDIVESGKKPIKSLNQDVTYLKINKEQNIKKSEVTITSPKKMPTEKKKKENQQENKVEGDEKKEKNVEPGMEEHGKLEREEKIEEHEIQKSVLNNGNDEINVLNKKNEDETKSKEFCGQNFAKSDRVNFKRKYTKTKYKDGIFQKRRKLTCDSCHTEFSHIEGLSNHILQSHEHLFEDFEVKNRIFNCRFCNEKFYSVPGKQLHTLTFHESPNSIPAKLKKKPKNICNICNEKFYGIIRLASHIRLNHSHIYKEFESKNQIHDCNFCTEKFYTKNSRRTHISNQHIKTKAEIISKTCNWTLENGNSCGKKISKRNRIKPHMYAHWKKTFTVTCNLDSKKNKEVCGVVYPLNMEKTHIKRYHRKSKPLKAKLCLFCGKSFAYMKGHIESQHGSPEETKTPHKFPCSQCGAKISNQAKLQLHENKCKKNAEGWTCEQCDDVLASKMKLDYHMFKSHEKNAVYCATCGKKFNHQHFLRKHEAIHSEKTVPCQYCGRLYGNEEKLKHHIYNIHPPDEKKMECSICNKKFRNKQGFEDHMNVHSGLKPYACLYCDTNFQNKANRYAHTRKLHSDKILTTKTNPADPAENKK